MFSRTSFRLSVRPAQVLTLCSYRVFSRLSTNTIIHRRNRVFVKTTPPQTKSCQVHCREGESSLSSVTRPSGQVREVVAEVTLSTITCSFASLALQPELAIVILAPYGLMSFGLGLFATKRELPFVAACSIPPLICCGILVYSLW